MGKGQGILRISTMDGQRNCRLAARPGIVGTTGMTPNNLIQQHFDDAYQIGLVEVERLARKILAKHPNLDEFVMAMGSAFFTTKDDGNVHPFERAYMKPLDRFLTAWDDTL